MASSFWLDFVTKAMTNVYWRLLSALLLGSVAVFGFAPYDFPTATLVALIGLWWLLADSPTWQQGMREGFAFGFGLFGFGISWMGISLGLYGGVPIGFAWLVALALVLILASFVAGVGALSVLVRPVLASWVWAMLWLPALWVISEWLRIVIWAGFPWLLIGYSHTDTWLAGWAPIAGTLGVSFALAVTAGLLWWAIASKNVFKGVLFYGLFLGFSGQLGLIDWVTPKDEKQPVALVHGQVSENLKWDKQALSYLLQAYQVASFPLLDQTKLVVWPETAIPTFLDSALPELQPIVDKATASNTTIITGVALREESIAGRQYFNSIVSLDGSLRYDKRHLVPFSEFYPGFSVLAAVARWMNMPMAQFSVGEMPKVQPIGSSLVGLGVCYEADFGYEMAQVSADADWWLIVSDDGWFYPSAMAGQHWQMTRLRARELGREIVRVTNQGYSGVAHIDGSGTIAALPEDDLAGHLVQVQAYSGLTPYVRWHDMPLLGLLSFIFALGLVRWRKSRQSSLH